MRHTRGAGEPTRAADHAPAPSARPPAATLRDYLRQLRETLVPRLLDRVYTGPDGGPNKHWLAFARRKFLNKEFP